VTTNRAPITKQGLEKDDQNNNSKITPNPQFYTRILNLTNIRNTKVKAKVLELGFQHSFVTTPKKWICELIIDTEMAISIFVGYFFSS
jgi:hypothetical protein